MTSALLDGPGFGFMAATIFFSLLPVVAAVWALRSLARLQRGQTETLARLAAIERRLSSDSSQSTSRFR